MMLNLTQLGVHTISGLKQLYADFFFYPLMIHDCFCFPTNLEEIVSFCLLNHYSDKDQNIFLHL